MKYFFYLLLIAPLTSNAQIDIYNITLTDTTKQVLYVGIDNRVRFSGVNADKFKTSIAGGGATLTRLEQNLFIVRVAQSGDTATIRLSTKNKDVFQKKFKIETIPDIVATVGYLTDSVVSKNRLLANPYLTAGCQCYLNLQVSIFSFEMMTKVADNEESTQSETMNYLSNEQLRIIKESKAGDKLYFQKIKATEPYGRTRYLKPFAIIIK